MKNIARKIIFFVTTMAVVGAAHGSSQQCTTTTGSGQYWYGWATCFVYIGGEPIDVSEYIEYSTTPNVQLSYAKQSCWATLFATATEASDTEDCAPIADFTVSQTPWSHVNHVVFTSSSTDDGEISSYAWYINGVYKGNSPSIYYPTPTAQVVQVKLIVTDNIGQTDETVESISLSAPVPPSCPPTQQYCFPEH